MTAGFGSLRTYTGDDVFVSEAIPTFVTFGEYPPRPSLERHAHDYVEIVVMLEGAGVHISAQGSVDMVPGSVAVVRPGAWHGLGETGDGRALWLGISTRCISTDLAFIRGRSQIRELLYTGPLGPEARGVWTHRIPEATAHRVAEEASLLRDVLLERPAEILVIVGQLIRTLGTLSADLPVEDSRQVLHPSVALVLDLIDSSPQRPWSIAELASRANIDMSYLSRLFRSQIGVPPMAYLARLRAEQAASLLTVTALPISQVGRRVGWPDPTHFSRRFHALMGLTPSEYRRLLSEPV